MDYDTYFGFYSNSSRSYQSSLKSHFDVCIDYEDIEDEEDFREDYPCPFCADDFDLVGLCCHIDEEHPTEANSGGIRLMVCPVCAVRVGIDMVDHITTQHGNLFKIRHKPRYHKVDSHSTMSSLRKELQDAHFQSLLSRSSSSASASSLKTAPDPLLSFIYNTPSADASESAQSDLGTAERADGKSSLDKTLEQSVHKSSLSDKDHMEKTKKSQFVQGLILSTMFDDVL